MILVFGTATVRVTVFVSGFAIFLAQVLPTLFHRQHVQFRCVWCLGLAVCLAVPFCSYSYLATYNLGWVTITTSLLFSTSKFSRLLRPFFKHLAR